LYRAHQTEKKIIVAKMTINNTYKEYLKMGYWKTKTEKAENITSPLRQHCTYAEQI
jgi:hypothetical protein